MILNITKPQYRRLIELLSLAQIEIEVFAEQGLLEISEQEAYQQLLNSIFKHAPKMNCEDALEYEEIDQSWSATEALFEYWFEKKYATEKVRFIEDLATAMAGKEIALEAIQTDKQLDESERIKAYSLLAEKNYHKLLKSGMGILEWVDEKNLKKRYPKLDVEDFLNWQAAILQPDDSLLDEAVETLPFNSNSSIDHELNNSVLDFSHPKVVPFPAKDMPTLNSAKDREVLQIKISLQGAKPPIWRRLEVVSDLTLMQLHKVIQDLFALYDLHLHGYFDDHGEIDESMEADLCLSEILIFEGSKLGYIYDFGDGWEFSIVLEKVKPFSKTQFAKTLAICTAGKRRGPLEDIGGIPILNEVVSLLKAGEKLPDFYMEYFGDNDPSEMLEYFDKQQTNQDLQKLSITL